MDDVKPPPPNRRPGGRAAAVRLAVHSAAIELLTESGYEGLAFPEVARRAGVNKTTVYRRWPTRVDLVYDLADSGAVTAEALHDTGSLVSDLESFLNAVVSSLQQPAVRAVLTVLATLGGDQEAQARRAQFWDERFRAAEAIVQRGIARGELADDVDARDFLERAVSPIYFRAVLLGRATSSSEVAVIARTIATPERIAPDGAKTLADSTGQRTTLC